MLFIPTLWYAMGAPAGLYLIVARLPGFASVRAPVNIWFVPALGLAVLAAAGLAAVAERWRVTWLCPLALGIFVVDLVYSNSANNQLAYARAPYEQIYGQGEDLFRRAVTQQLPPLTRFDAPEHLPSFGPLAHYFDARTEVTYGYDPLTLALYSDYYSAIRQNPRLRDGLNVARWLDASAGAVRPNPGALPRAMFPREIVAVASAEESHRLLASLDQSRRALAPARIRVTQDANASASVTEFAPGHYKIHWRCASDSVLRISNAYFDGWTARTGARSLPVFPVDHALMGVVAPAGEGDIALNYHSTYFAAGAIVTLAALLGCLALLAAGRGRPAINP
jgi:hypothetical protein